MTVRHLVSRDMDKARAGMLADLLSELAWPQAAAVALHEADESQSLWRVEAYYETLDEDALAGALVAAGFGADEMRAEPLPEVNWVEESLKGLTPVRAGRFFIHGSHDRMARPAAGISIEIDAGVAFGTGHHGTTQGCLLALEHVGRLGRPRSVLDVGTGSGVLAIAAARLWRVPVVASDIDPVAIPVARANARRNGAGAFIRFVTAPGVRHRIVRESGPYELVMANILAGPLRRMAGDICARVERGGWLVLSGLLTRQEAMLEAAYGACGMRLVRRIRIGEWSTLLLRRP